MPTTRNTSSPNELSILEWEKKLWLSQKTRIENSMSFRYFGHYRSGAILKSVCQPPSKLAIGSESIWKNRCSAFANSSRRF